MTSDSRLRPMAGAPRPAQLGCDHRTGLDGRRVTGWVYHPAVVIALGILSPHEREPLHRAVGWAPAPTGTLTNRGIHVRSEVSEGVDSHEWTSGDGEYASHSRHLSFGIHRSAAQLLPVCGF